MYNKIRKRPTDGLNSQDGGNENEETRGFASGSGADVLLLCGACGADLYHRRNLGHLLRLRRRAGPVHHRPFRRRGHGRGGRGLCGQHRHAGHGLCAAGLCAERRGLLRLQRHPLRAVRGQSHHQLYRAGGAVQRDRAAGHLRPVHSVHGGSEGQECVHRRGGLRRLLQRHGLPGGL